MEPGRPRPDDNTLPLQQKKGAPAVWRALSSLADLRCAVLDSWLPLFPFEPAAHDDVFVRRALSEILQLRGVLFCRLDRARSLNGVLLDDLEILSHGGSARNFCRRVSLRAAKQHQPEKNERDRCEDYSEPSGAAAASCRYFVVANEVGESAARPGNPIRPAGSWPAFIIAKKTVAVSHVHHIANRAIENANLPSLVSLTSHLNFLARFKIRAFSASWRKSAA